MPAMRRDLLSQAPRNATPCIVTDPLRMIDDPWGDSLIQLLQRSKTTPQLQVQFDQHQFQLKLLNIKDNEET